jgi:hypothetical protein
MPARLPFASAPRKGRSRISGSEAVAVRWRRHGSSRSGFRQCAGAGQTLFPGPSYTVDAGPGWQQLVRECHQAVVAESPSTNCRPSSKAGPLASQVRSFLGRGRTRQLDRGRAQTPGPDHWHLHCAQRGHLRALGYGRFAAQDPADPSSAVRPMPPVGGSAGTVVRRACG